MKRNLLHLLIALFFLACACAAPTPPRAIFGYDVDKPESVWAPWSAHKNWTGGYELQDCTGMIRATASCQDDAELICERVNSGSKP